MAIGSRRVTPTAPVAAAVVSEATPAPTSTPCFQIPERDVERSVAHVVELADLGHDELGLSRFGMRDVDRVAARLGDLPELAGQHGDDEEAAAGQRRLRELEIGQALAEFPADCVVIACNTATSAALGARAAANSSLTWRSAEKNSTMSPSAMVPLPTTHCAAPIWHSSRRSAFVWGKMCALTAKAP